ncbi:MULTISPECIES: efflux RND transporter permease subunit [unclassified Mucilaginibacter]|uniref:efflux RND transporter permease subunit n=1 Tax=unclassified Mucilaginibacter TaxID=2617802 RepID=UPI002AC9ED4C|nr:MULTISPECIES: efflux RND transporter permease subunit [unclassified Mucilaginibacter]MEB0262798.1 efflux RND transporter permease subunit [Mucilaginibacter sp. 10I4]MEB0278181.1 efflux RND transporter permease subunit [Mucilaginibacter sp. 10B2]MEB0302063.1 efflux RND transporter permease subunit [Mucilaginibacter sp. 5C4]WPX23827.1 efflux RND transporter permease subunit [Mucilaginibacter sp. 5C4]
MLKLAFKNKYLVIVVCLLVAIISIVSLQKLPVDILPTYKSSAIQILTLYPGMPAEVMEKDITSRLERWTGQAEGVQSQESKSMIGVSILRNYYGPEIDPSTAMSQATSLATSDLYYLPPGTIPPMVMPYDPTASVPLALLAVSSDQLSEKELYDIAYFQLRNLLGSVQGIIAPAVYGGKLRRIYMYVYPEKLQAYGLSQTDIVQAIQKNNVMIPTGDINIGPLNYSVNANGMLPKVDDFNNIIIKMKDGAPIYLHDVGYAKDASAIQTNIVHINGKRQVYIPIYKRPKANTIAAIEAVNDKLAVLKTRLPKSVNLNIILDQSDYVRNSISGLEKEGVTGLVLVSLALLLFLGNFRSALIVFISIPLSIMFTFIAMYFTGDSINSITLGGIALAIGLLVDDSIVVLENIDKHLKMGKTPAQAAFDGAQEVAMPVLVTTLTICIVFFPVVFLTGIAKFLFAPLAVVVCFAMIGSRIFSMTLVPVAAAMLLKPYQKDEHLKNGFLATFDRFIERITTRYSYVIAKLLPKAWYLIAGVLFVFAVSVFGFMNLGTELFPKMDVGQISIDVRMESGTRIENTETTITEIEHFLKENVGSDLRTTVSNIGVLNDWPAAYTPNSGTQDATLSMQLNKGHKPTAAYVRELRKKLKDKFPGVEFIFNTGGIVTQALNFGLPSPIDIQITGNDLQKARTIAENIRNVVNTVSGTEDVRVQQRYDHPELKLNIDRQKAALLHIDADDIVKNTVSALNSSVNFKPSFWIDDKNGNHYFVGVTYPEAALDKPGVLGNIGITAANGSPMSLLKNVAVTTLGSAPIEINHVDIQRVTDIYSNTDGRDIGSISKDIEKQLKIIRKTLPEGYTITMRGEVQSMRESFSNLGLGLGLAVVLIYLVIVPLLRSFKLPLIIISVIPLGLIGVTAVMLLTNTYLNIQSMMGIIMMAGISVAYSNLLVDKMNNLLKEGKLLPAAILEGVENRFRPILMTSVVAILALLPMAIGYETGGEANVPLARAIVGGVIAATFLTLFFVPVLFYVMNKKNQLKLMKTSTICIIIPILIFFTSCGQQKPENQVSIPFVGVTFPVKHSFNNVLNLTGNAMAYQQTKIFAQTSGYLSVLKVDIGDFVKKGEVLAVLNNPELLQKKEMLAADLQAKSALNTRLQNILHKTPQLTTATDVENAKAAYDVAKATYQALLIQLGYLQIRAPFVGVITKRYVSAGDVIQNGLSNSTAIALFDLQNLNPIRLMVNVPETNAGDITKNTVVKVGFAEIPGKTYLLKVTRLAYGLDMDTKTMQAEVDMPNNDLKLRPGMYANVSFEMGSDVNLLSVPNAAIGNVDGKAFLYLVSNHIVKKIPVTIGFQDGQYTEVKGASINPDDRIVVTGKELCTNELHVDDKLINN